MNIQHSTFNIQRPVFPPRRGLIGCSVLNVECWMFLIFALSTLSLPAQNTNALPPLAPAHAEIPPTFWEQQQDAIRQHGIATSIIAACLSAFVVGFLFHLLKPKPKPVPPPEIAARQALDKLRNVPEDGRLLSEVSQIMRRYFAAAFQLPAGESTTAEVIAGLARTEEIHFEVGLAASLFFRECDERKFSPQGQTAPFHAVQRALELIDQAEQHRVRNAPIPGAATPATPGIAAKAQPDKNPNAAASGDGRTP
jgi:hypothetical protein